MKFADFLNRFVGEKGTPRYLWLLTLGAIGVALLFLGEFFPGPQKPVPPGDGSANQVVKGVAQNQSRLEHEESYLAAQMEKMLSQIEGAGAVDVVVKLEGSAKVEYATNANTGRRVTEEKESGTVQRLTTENDANDQLVVVRGEQGFEAPVVEREVSPRVVGVLVVAEGAADPYIKAKIFYAVQVALGVEPQKVLVLPKQV
ncbi:MAG: hypothetical protein ACUVRC_08285 [Desulfotomaculales bacterium]